MTSIDQNYRLRERNRNEADPATQMPLGGYAAWLPPALAVPCVLQCRCLPVPPVDGQLLPARWPRQGGCARLHLPSPQRPCGLTAACFSLSSTTLAGARYLIASFSYTPN